ncbi:SDR family NAD(P)-dependent oxidoreductase [Bermanella sp. R86510]|uniref:SDR family NAD(P)-dependent oxidoreductase n=1 Tax=unclassified Bermanella TaxID=2627862 RepID=UPI0037CAD4B8
MTSFLDKTALITGAGSGIGQALAIALAKQGCHLALNDISELGLKETLEKIALLPAPQVNTRTYIFDVSNRAEFEKAVSEIESDFTSLNFVFNNAGVALSSTAQDVKRADFEWLMGINFWGVVNGSELCLPLLKASGEGHIINISSVFGMISIARQSSYNAAKFAVRGYTEALAQEMALEGNTVNVSCVHPGGINTNIAQQARISEDEDRDELVASFSKLARTQPEKAAAVILKGVKKNKRRIMVGTDAHLIHFLVRLLGAGYQPLTQWFAKRFDYI